MAARQVDDGNLEHLQPERKVARSRFMRVTAAAMLPPAEMPSDADAARVDAELLRVLEQPHERRMPLLDLSGIAVLGSEGVVDRHDRDLASTARRR